MKRIGADALAAMEEHSWPGNVRELENLIQRLIITTRHQEIGPADLPFADAGAKPGCQRSHSSSRRGHRL